MAGLEHISARFSNLSICGSWFGKAVIGNVTVMQMGLSDCMEKRGRGATTLLCVLG